MTRWSSPHPDFFFKMSKDIFLKMSLCYPFCFAAVQGRRPFCQRGKQHRLPHAEHSSEVPFPRKWCPCPWPGSSTRVEWLTQP